MTELIHGSKLEFRPISQYTGLPKAGQWRTGVFLEYADTDRNFCRIMTEGKKIIIVNKMYVMER